MFENQNSPVFRCHLKAKLFNYWTTFYHSIVIVVRFWILTLLFYFFIIIKFTSDKVMLNLP